MAITRDELKAMVLEAMEPARAHSFDSVKPVNEAQTIADTAASAVIDNIPNFPAEDLQEALEQLQQLLLPVVESMIMHAEESTGSPLQEKKTLTKLQLKKLVQRELHQILDESEGIKGLVLGQAASGRAELP